MEEKLVTPKPHRKLNEDWLAVAIAFILMILAALGILGPNGINITF